MKLKLNKILFVLLLIFLIISFNIKTIFYSLNEKEVKQLLPYFISEIENGKIGDDLDESKEIYEISAKYIGEKQYFVRISDNKNREYFFLVDSRMNGDWKNQLLSALNMHYFIIELKGDPNNIPTENKNDK